MANDSLEAASIFWRILNLLHRYICIFVRLLMVKLYDERGQSMPPIDDRLLLESATSIAEKIRTKQVTSTQVMNAFIRRIKQINPLLNCVVDERYTDALQEAAEVDELIASNKYTVDELKESKPFLGVPVSAKDFIGVKGMILTCGIWARRGIRSSKDADTIQLMREAGAIPFAVTNVPELCMAWESSNTIYGRTRNPYDTNRTPGGSSGGEGSLLAAAGSPFGLGSDLAGSVRLPAFFNGIFGHKPSPYIVSRGGVWPESTAKERLLASSIGPMSRFACDLKPMLKVLAGDKAKELRLDDPVDVSSLKYFYQENDGGAFFVTPVDDDIRVGLNKVIQYLRTGLKVEPQHVQFEEFKESIPIWSANVKLAIKTCGFEDLLVNLDGRIDTYPELLKWLIGKSKHTLAGLLNAVDEKIGIQYGSPYHQMKVKQRDDLYREFEEMLGDNGVLIYPTHPTVAPYHNEPILKGFNIGYTAIFNVLGLPSTAIPLGIGSEGLPIGIQVVANRNQDRLCLAVASELEKAFGGWVAPEIIT